MKVFGMCINKKVLAGLVVAALGIWWLVPDAIGAALPLLVLALCPLSMLFMMKSMNNMQNRQPASPTAASNTAAAAAPVDEAVASGRERDRDAG